MTMLCRIWLWKRVAAATLLMLSCELLSLAQFGMAQAVDPRPAPTLIHSLENRQFVGRLGSEKKSNPGEDVLIFKDGRFSSRTCLQYGFLPAPYWVRRDADGLHFLVELHSSENGTLRFEGSFNGKELAADAVWSKKRWYWTVKQKLRFQGRPAD